MIDKDFPANFQLPCFRERESLREEREMEGLGFWCLEGEGSGAENGHFRLFLPLYEKAVVKHTNYLFS